jgi:hypothetical protein
MSVRVEISLFMALVHSGQLGEFLAWCTVGFCSVRGVRRVEKALAEAAAADG